ncbi:MAG: pilus assembly protein PilM [Fidelibacterota bacterium]
MLFREALSIGLDIGNNAIKIAGIRKQRIPKIEFLRHFDFFLSRKVKHFEDLTDTIIVQVLRDLVQTIPGTIHRVHTTLSTNDTAIRTLEIPTIGQDEIKPALRWNLASMITTPIEHMEYDYHVLNRNRSNNMMSVVVGIASQESLNKHISMLQRAKLEPISVDIDSLAVYNAFIALYTFEEEKPIILLNIGAEKTSLIIAHPELDPLIASYPFGGNQLTRQIEAHLHVSFCDADEEKIKLGTEVESGSLPGFTDKKNQELLFQFTDSLYEIVNYNNIYYQIQHGADPAGKIFITGGGANLHKLDFLLAQKTRIPVFRWNPLESENLNFNSDDMNAKTSGLFYTTAIGLALRE